ncbi:MAG: amino acid ABC transporter ATP-binding protein [Paracoccaceae bacterium]|nr:amino acid ABC transporter ATP-binding protein [Paracoccaceae bacterium]
MMSTNNLGLGKKIIETFDIRKSFGDLEVLKGLSLEISEGKTMVIVGPSGSGKSTLIRCFNLLETINAGKILFEGRPISGADKTAWKIRLEIGMVFQNFELFSHLTVLENIILAPTVVKKIEKVEATEKAMELLKKVQIPEKASSFPDELSGGQQQRVAIARSLAMEPKLMLYDEPTSALDPEMIKEVLDVIQELSQEGMTSVVVTHEMGFARKVADSIVFMDHGKVIENTTSDKFFGGEVSDRAKVFLEQILSH